MPVPQRDPLARAHHPRNRIGGEPCRQTTP